MRVFKFLITSKPPPCLQRSEWLKVRALSALTIKNSEEECAVVQVNVAQQLGNEN
jgi:hypothetical protein